MAVRAIIRIEQPGASPTMEYDPSVLLSVAAQQLRKTGQKGQGNLPVTIVLHDDGLIEYQAGAVNVVHRPGSRQTAQLKLNLTGDD